MTARSKADYRLYNTAVRSARDGSRERAECAAYPGVVELKGIKAFKHDICKGAHPVFHEADGMYSEIAWKAGYSSFTADTDAQGTTHSEYLLGLKSCIYELRIPTYIVCGKREAAKLNPQAVKGIRFLYHHGSPAVLCAWFAGIPAGIETDVDAREHMVGKSSCILDPCCGFGNTARRAVSLRKRGIMADINEECVAYVQQGKYMQGE